MCAGGWKAGTLLYLVVLNMVTKYLIKAHFIKPAFLTVLFLTALLSCNKDKQDNCEGCSGFSQSISYNIDETIQVEISNPGNPNVLQPLSPVASGTVTLGGSMVVSDEEAEFNSNGIISGAIIKNTTNNTYTTILSVISDQELELADDIFSAGDEYSILNWKFGGGELGVDFVYNHIDSNIAFLGACYIELPNILTNGKYYSITYSGYSNGLGTGKTVINNGFGIPPKIYAEIGTETLIPTTSYLFNQANGGTLRIEGLAPYNETVVYITGIAVSEMVTTTFNIIECSTGDVSYSSVDEDIQYNTGIKYQDVSTPFEAIIPITWSNYGLSDACYCICVSPI